MGWNVQVINDCLCIYDADTNRLVLQHNGHAGVRPYIHPLRGPDGAGCLTEDSPWHHPWQHGISTGFHGVNGCDFWYDPGQRPGESIGSIVPSPPRLINVDPLRWTVEAIWRHTDGSYLLAEEQTWTMKRADTASVLDLEWRLQAIPEVTIGQLAYGGLFLRMPFREERGAEVVNSSGLRNDECEQQAAEWVDLFMPIDRGDSYGGIAIFDHPDNPGHPARWRVDGSRGINPSPCIPGPIDLAAGETVNYRYRLLAHREKLQVEKLQEHWTSYRGTIHQSPQA